MSRNLTDIPLVTQLFSAKKCVTQGISTVHEKLFVYLLYTVRNSSFSKDNTEKIDGSTLVAPTWPPTDNFFPIYVKRPQLSNNKKLDP